MKGSHVMPTKFEMSVEAQRILDYLRTTKPGDHITYEFLAQLTGLNDVATMRARFYTAARRAFTLWQMRFGPIRGVGYIRLDATAISWRRCDGTQFNRHAHEVCRYHEPDRSSEVAALAHHRVC